MTSTEQNLRYAQSTSGGFVLVSLYSWAVMTCVIVIARFLRALFVHKIKFGGDDIAALASILIYVGTVVSWQHAVDAGLGRNITEIDAQHVSMFSKAVLAAQLLDTLTMLFAKLSFAFLVHRIVPQPVKARASFCAILVAWGTFSCFIIAFRCDSIGDWAAQPKLCHSTGPLMASIAFNLLTDLILAGWLFPTLATLAVDKERRFTAMILFGSRAIVCPVAGIQIWTAITAFSGENPTRDVVDFAILSQAVTGLSLIMANVPRVKQLLGTGGSGMLYPNIQASEQSKVRSSANYQTSENNTLKLVPSGTPMLTTTVTSKGSNAERTGGTLLYGPSHTMLGSVDARNTSTTNLVHGNNYEGVVLEQRDFLVVVETQGDEMKKVIT